MEWCFEVKLSRLFALSLFLLVLGSFASFASAANYSKISLNGKTAYTTQTILDSDYIVASDKTFYGSQEGQVTVTAYLTSDTAKYYKVGLETKSKDITIDSVTINGSKSYKNKVKLKKYIEKQEFPLGSELIEVKFDILFNPNEIGFAEKFDIILYDDKENEIIRLDPVLSGFDYRRQITVTNNSSAAAVDVNYPVSIVIDTNTIIGEFKLQPNCNDLRITWGEGTEIPSNFDQCNSTDTNIFFNVQSQIAASGTDNNYFTYYGDSDASFPDYNTGMHLAFDGTNGWDINANTNIFFQQIAGNNSRYHNKVMWTGVIVNDGPTFATGLSSASGNWLAVTANSRIDVNGEDSAVTKITRWNGSISETIVFYTDNAFFDIQDFNGADASANKTFVILGGLGIDAEITYRDADSNSYSDTGTLGGITNVEMFGAVALHRTAENQAFFMLWKASEADDDTTTWINRNTGDIIDPFGCVSSTGDCGTSANYKSRFDNKTKVRFGMIRNFNDIEEHYQIFINEPTTTLASEEFLGDVTANFNMVLTPAALDPENGITSVTVDFNDTSAYSNSVPTAFSWDENSVQFSTDQNTSKTYTSIADFNINFQVDVNTGSSDTNWQVLRIRQAPQGVDYTFDVNSYFLTGVDINFFGTLTSSVDSWQWKKDGVIFSNDQNTGPEEFNFSGDFNVCVTATFQDVNKIRCRSVFVTRVIVKVPKSEEDLSILAPYSLNVFTVPKQGLSGLTGDNNVFIATDNSTTGFIIEVDFNASYFSRFYTVVADGVQQTLQPYLVPIAEGTSMTLITQNTIDSSRIPGVLVEIYKTIEGESERQIVEVVTTDAKGEALISGITNDFYEYLIFFNGELIESVDITVTSSTVYLSFSPSIVSDLPIGSIVSCLWLPGGGKLKPGQTNIKLTINVNNATVNSADVNAVQSNDVNVFFETFTGITDGFSNTFSVTSDFASWTDSNFSLSIDVNMALASEKYFFCRQIYILSDLNRTGDIWLDLMRDGVRNIDLGCEEGIVCGVTILASLFLTIIFCGVIVVQTPFRDSIGIIILAMVILGFFVWVEWLPFFIYIILFMVGGLGMIAAKVIR